MSEPIDLDTSARQLLAVAQGVTDDQLDASTPCDGRTVGQLLAHVVGLTAAFKAAADKDFGPWTDTDPDANGWPELEDGWRETLAERVPALVEAWRSPEAWQGMTRAGGVDLPGEVAGLVALDEIVLHGWDLARATGQSYECDDATAAACMAFVGQFDPSGTPGLFGPAVPVDQQASAFEQVLTRSGRDPHWS
ncbi:TIGR03086 family protein [Nocardioides gansuensis]|uniref:TIGR03086 family protein n=1 Tax=Nocardioides gansuensis TaxID=2138300 RepID=A0A2T8FA48_9ACTN|nr:TIGR03086 family metal-binding protein [Nocardioides gansuensis]PVG82611.1 TIGR03086 family protein [Nocardioides gansuensis]